MYGEVEVQLQALLTTTLEQDEWLASRPGGFTANKKSRYPLDLGRPATHRLSKRSGENKNTFPAGNPTPSM
jgi:hypothetical protein